jgi:hypothetical protein
MPALHINVAFAKNCSLDALINFARHSLTSRVTLCVVDEYQLTNLTIRGILHMTRTSNFIQLWDNANDQSTQNHLSLRTIL